MCVVASLDDLGHRLKLSAALNGAEEKIRLDGLHREAELLIQIADYERSSGRSLATWLRSSGSLLMGYARELVWVGSLPEDDHRLLRIAGEIGRLAGGVVVERVDDDWDALLKALDETLKWIDDEGLPGVSRRA